jgi:hypothetical protein
MIRIARVLLLSGWGGLLLGAGPAPKVRPKLPQAPIPARAQSPLLAPVRVELAPAPGPGAHGGETKCEACHSASSWTDVRFNHDKTGFILRDAHRRADCKACHPVDFKTKVSRSCAGCHRDPHAGELGARCEGCHDEASWRSRFTADSHRTGNFPLVGRHAILPCEECHAAAPSSSFSRPTTPCVGCHQRDYERTASTSLDHRQAGFSTECRECHGAWSFTPGRFLAHEACFQLSGGPHRGIGCPQCHTRLTGFQVAGTCNTRSAACSGCHTHQCATSDREHDQVPGYQCQDRKCYECHRFTGEKR